MDRGTLNTVRKKHNLFRRWVQTCDGQDYHDYIRARNFCRKAKKQRDATIAAEAKKNPKTFWSYVVAKTSAHLSVADLGKDDGNKTTTDRQKA